MKPRRPRHVLATLATTLIASAAFTSADTYSQNFDAFADGTTDLRDGTAFNGASASIQGGRLQLTIDNQGLGFASFTIPALANSSQGWSMTADIEMFDAVGGNPPADGFSFNYGDFVIGERGQAEDGMAGRAGVNSNISFEVDTWMNFDGEQGVNISGVQGGVDIGNQLGAFNNGPILNDGQRVIGTMSASYNAAAGTVSFATTGLNTNADFVNIDLGGNTGNDDWNFGFSARVGGANQDLFIDNLVITTDPVVDTDGDGLTDIYELANGLDPLDNGLNPNNSGVSGDPDQGAAGDPDGDGLTNIEERDAGTDPQSDDSDGDGLADGVETGTGIYVDSNNTGTDPTSADSDDDGLDDGVEDPNLPFVDVNQPGTDPNNTDTDGDGFGDLTDILLGQDPTVANSPTPATSNTTYKSNFGAYADGTTDLQDGTTITGAAARIQGGQLMLTEDLRGLGFSSFTVPPLKGSSNGWTATFDLTITDSLGGNVPADGLSLNYGNAAEGELGSAEEGMGAIGSVTENLSFEIDTWMNFDPEQGVNIAEKVGGVDNNLSFTNGPILDDGTSVGGAVTISWNPVDGASFTTTGLLTNADFSNVATSFVPDDNHTFIFSARVGGANQTVLIDNLCISTVSIDRHDFAVSSADNGANIDFSWDSNGSEVYSIVSTDDPVANPDPNTWPVVAALENIAATPPLNLASIPKPAEALRLFKLIAAPVPPLFSEDFESGLNGWTAGIDDALGNTAWELGAPNGTSGPITGADGSANAFSTNIGDYGIDSDIFLRSPDIDLTGATAACLAFEQFRDADGFADIGTVRILKASDLSELQVIDPDVFALDVDFVSFSADLDPAVLGETIIIEFRYQSDNSADGFSGWTIDNVEVTLK
jgi:hypothetical protein